MSIEKLTIMALLFLVDATPAHKIGSPALSKTLGPGDKEGYVHKQYLKKLLEDQLEYMNKTEKLWEETHNDEH